MGFRLRSLGSGLELGFRLGARFTFLSISSSVMLPSGTWKTLSYAELIPLLTPRTAASLARSSSAWIGLGVRGRARTRGGLGVGVGLGGPRPPGAMEGQYESKRAQAVATGSPEPFSQR